MFMVMERNSDNSSSISPYHFVSSHTNFEDAKNKLNQLREHFKDLENTRSIYRGWTPHYVIVQEVG